MGKSASFIRLPEVQRKTGLSKPWLYRLIARGEFPKQVKIGTKAVAFIESEVDDWIAKKVNASRS